MRKLGFFRNCSGFILVKSQRRTTEERGNLPGAATNPSTCSRLRRPRRDKAGWGECLRAACTERPRPAWGPRSLPRSARGQPGPRRPAAGWARRCRDTTRDRCDHLSRAPASAPPRSPRRPEPASLRAWEGGSGHLPAYPPPLRSSRLQPEAPRDGRRPIPGGRARRREGGRAGDRPRPSPPSPRALAPYLPKPRGGGGDDRAGAGPAPSPSPAPSPLPGAPAPPAAPARRWRRQVRMRQGGRPRVGRAGGRRG